MAIKYFEWLKWTLGPAQMASDMFRHFVDPKRSTSGVDEDAREALLSNVTSSIELSLQRLSAGHREELPLVPRDIWREAGEVAGNDAWNSIVGVMYGGNPDSLREHSEETLQLGLRYAEGKRSIDEMAPVTDRIIRLASFAGRLSDYMDSIPVAPSIGARSAPTMRSQPQRAR